MHYLNTCEHYCIGYAAENVEFSPNAHFALVSSSVCESYCYGPLANMMPQSFRRRAGSSRFAHKLMELNRILQIAKLRIGMTVP
ncbi:hypothetical protein DEV91_11755 [Phyllobacterium brassicacearum]|nr:hypothetical protein DEV91_11755 [Phyllobacterium brassicacearum]